MNSPTDAQWDAENEARWAKHYQERASAYAEQLQQIAEALNMPFSPGHLLVERVRDLVRKSHSP